MAAIFRINSSVSWSAGRLLSRTIITRSAESSSSRVRCWEVNSMEWFCVFSGDGSDGVSDGLSVVMVLSRPAVS